MKLPSVLLAAGLLALAQPGSASADDVAAAARAYSKAQAAELADKPARAAVLYELADNTAPAPEALRGAARTRLAAGDDAIAASHALELRRRYPEDDTSRAIAARILERVAGKLTRVDVTCRQPCTLTLDGAAVGLEPRKRHGFYASPGTGELAARFDGGAERQRSVKLRSGARVRIDLAPPVPAEEPDEIGPLPPPVPLARSTTDEPGADDPTAAEESSEASGLSKAWFVSGVGLTLALAGAATWSGLDVLDSYHHYEEDPTEDGYQDGLRRERRTNILIGAAAASAAATLTIAIFTRWSSPDEERPPQRSVVVAPVTGGALVAVDGRF